MTHVELQTCTGSSEDPGMQLLGESAVGKHRWKCHDCHETGPIEIDGAVVRWQMKEHATQCKPTWPCKVPCGDCGRTRWFAWDGVWTCAHCKRGMTTADIRAVGLGPSPSCPSCSRPMNWVHCDDRADWVCNSEKGCGYGT